MSGLISDFIPIVSILNEWVDDGCSKELILQLKTIQPYQLVIVLELNIKQKNCQVLLISTTNIKRRRTLDMKYTLCVNFDYSTFPTNFVVIKEKNKQLYKFHR